MRKASVIAIYLIVLIGLMQLVIAFLVTDGFCLSFDEAIWHYIGRNWFRNGLIPYSGGVDNKSPLIFAIFGLSDYLFNVNFWFPRILGTVFETAGIFFLYRTGKKIGGDKAGIFVILFYGLSLLWRSTGSKYVSFSESFEIPFIIAAFYFYFRETNRKNLFISGLLAGAGVCFRISGLFGSLTLMIATIRKGFLHFIPFIAGFFCSVFAIGLTLVLAGIHVQDFFSYGIIENFRSGSITDHSLIWRTENLFDGFFYSELLLFLPGLIGYLLIKRKIDLIVLWFILEFIGINVIGLYARQHFKSVLPPLALVNAIWVSWLIEKYKVPGKYLLIIVFVCFFPKLLEPIIALKNLLKPVNIPGKEYCVNPELKIFDGDKKKLGLWLKDHSNEHDKIYVAGLGAVVQTYSERLSPTIYFNLVQTQKALKRIRQDLSPNYPDIIVVPAFSDYSKQTDPGIRKFLDDYISVNYKYDTCLYSYRIFRISRSKRG